MILAIFLLGFVIGLVLLFSGFIYNDNQHMPWFSLAGALILILLGITLFNTGIEVPTGTETFQNETTQRWETVQTYTSVDDFMVDIISWVTLLSGFFGLVKVRVLFNSGEVDDSPRFEEFG